MNTKKITDARLGSSNADAIYLGSSLVWKRDDEFDNIPQSDRLLSLFTKSTYDCQLDESNVMSSTATWTDYITKDSLSLSNSYLTSHDAAVAKGIRMCTGTVYFPILCSNNTGSFYIRARLCSAYRSAVIFLRLQTTSFYGMTLYYEKGTLTIYKHAGHNNNPVETVATDINPHEYHTYSFVCEGSSMKFYIDGEYYTETEIDIFPKYFCVANAFNTHVTTASEIVAVYDGAHSDEEVYEISEKLNSKYPYEIIPAEKGVVLYDHGDLCEEVTGGWSLHTLSDWNGTICSLNDDHILINGTNASVSRIPCAQTTNKIDFTPYTKLYFLVSSPVHIGELSYVNSVMGTKCGYSSGEVTDANSRTYTDQTVSSIGGKIGTTEDDAVLVCMDISNVSGSYSPLMADGSGRSDGTGGKLYKVWIV